MCALAVHSRSVMCGLLCSMNRSAAWTVTAGRPARRCRRRWHGVTLLCVTHDVGETRLFDRVLVVDDGRIVEDDQPDRLAAAPSRYRQLLDAESDVLGQLWESGDWRRVAIRNGRVHGDSMMDGPDLRPAAHASQSQADDQDRIRLSWPREQLGAGARGAGVAHWTEVPRPAGSIGTPDTPPPGAAVYAGNWIEWAAGCLGARGGARGVSGSRLVRACCGHVRWCLRSPSQAKPVSAAAQGKRRIRRADRPRSAPSLACTRTQSRPPPPHSIEAPMVRGDLDRLLESAGSSRST